VWAQCEGRMSGCNVGGRESARDASSLTAIGSDCDLIVPIPCTVMLLGGSVVEC
jgi:hypothetical protein